MTSVCGSGGRPLYRVRQFLAALAAFLAPLRPADLDEARSYLPPTAWPLFLSMGRADQKHSLSVLRTLRQRGELNPALAQAALLHDCAKHGARVRLWHRVALVLLAAWTPGRLADWSAAEPASASWRYPLWALRHHPQRGADLARDAGCDAQAVWLIEHHQDHALSEAGEGHSAHWLTALQAADDDN